MLFFDRHRRFRNDLSAYIDGELPPGRSEALEAHVAACDACRTELDGLRATVAAIESLPEVAPRRSFALTPERLAAPREEQAREPSQALAGGARMAAAGLAAALVIVAGIDLADSGTDRDGASVPAFQAAGDDSADYGGFPGAPEYRFDFDGDATGAEDIGGSDGMYGPLSGEGAGSGGDGIGGPGEDAGGAIDDFGGDADEPEATGLPPAAPMPNADRAPVEGGAVTSGGDDAGTRDTAAAGDSDGGFNTLLAIEIALGAALAAVLMWLARQWLLGRSRARGT